MAVKKDVKHIVSTTPPGNLAVGDEWFNPSTNLLYKSLAANGTTVGFSEVLTTFTKSTYANNVTTADTTSLVLSTNKTVDSGTITIDPGTIGNITVTPSISGALVVAGNVAIGNITAPLGNLHISTDSAASVWFDRYGNAPPNMIYRRANGTKAAPTAVVLDNQLFALGGRGYGATGFSSGGRAAIFAAAAETWTDSAQGAYFAITTTPTGSTTAATRLRVEASGQVNLSANIGSTSTTSGTFVVTGGVGVSENLYVGGNTVVTGNLTVNGTTTTVNSTVTTLDDPIITLGGDTSTAEVTKDRGIEAKWNGITLTMTNFIGNGTTTVTGTVASTTGYAVGDIITISGATGTEQTKLNGTWKIASVPSGTTFTFVVLSTVTAGTYTATLGTTVKSKNAFFGLDQSTGKFTFIPQSDNNAEVFSGTAGTITAGDVQIKDYSINASMWSRSFALMGA